jgi:hypothetical protein
MTINHYEEEEEEERVFLKDAQGVTFELKYN